MNSPRPNKQFGVVPGRATVHGAAVHRARRHGPRRSPGPGVDPQAEQAGCRRATTQDPRQDKCNLMRHSNPSPNTGAYFNRIRHVHRPHSPDRSKQPPMDACRSFDGVVQRLWHKRHRDFRHRTRGDGGIERYVVSSRSHRYRRCGLAAARDRHRACRSRPQWRNGRQRCARR